MSMQKIDNTLAVLDNSLNDYMNSKRSEGAVDINQSHNLMIFLCSTHK